MNKDELKTRLVDYLRAEGVEVNAGVSKPKIKCLNHAEANASMSVNLDKHFVYCHGCQWGGDVFKVAGLMHDLTDFKDQLKNVADTLGVELDKKEQTKKKKFVTVSPEKAKEIYNKKYFQELAERNGWGDFTTGWLYRNGKGDVDLIDVRFDGLDKKNVISFWWDGERVQSKSPPVKMYNRDLLHRRKDAPVLVVEGAKSAACAAVLEKFVTVTWNGGGSKVKLAPWAALKRRTVFIYPDDDQKNDPKTKKLLPELEQAGMKAALAIKEQLPEARIIKPPEKARSVKPSGADVVEALEVMTPTELTEYILNAREVVPPPMLTPEEILNAPKTPFRILGTDDYGRAHFVGRNDRMWNFSMSSLTKTQLLSVAPYAWWEDEFPNRGKVDWEKATDAVIEVATIADFDPLIIRGRGAWSDDYGRFCYHDGRKTIGHIDKKHLYVRKTKRDIGIEETPAEPEALIEIERINASLSYETRMDAVRLLAWATIAPFAGALPWRPSILMTGPSESGKTQILDLVVRPISHAEVFSGGDTTEPGVRQTIGNDSCAIIIEESEADTKKKKFNRDALFGMMRQSTSNDAPRTAKGSLEGRSVNYSMRSMFAFIAVDPSIEFVADENRMFRINLVKASAEERKKYKEEYKPKLIKLLGYDESRAIRAFVWRDLKAILGRAYLYADVIEEVTGANSRYSLAEGILQSVYWSVWRNQPEIGIKKISQNVMDLYTICPPETSRDEAAELLDRIVDRKVQIEKPNRETVSIREICYALKNGVFEHNEGEAYPRLLNERDDITHLRGVICRNGVSLIDNGEFVAVDCHSDEIKKSLDISRGYHRQLYRHENAEKKSRSVHMAGKTRRCVVIKGVI